MMVLAATVWEVKMNKITPFPKSPTGGRGGYIVHDIDSPAGQTALLVQSLTTKQLFKAIEYYKKTHPDVTVGTVIGVTHDGFFFSQKENDPKGKHQPIGFLDWWCIHDLLKDAGTN